MAAVQQFSAIVLLVTMMFNAGLQADRLEILAVLTNYGLLLRALLANFIVVPLAAYLIVTAFRMNDLVATGIMLMAIAPGVPFVLLAAGRPKGGSHELAVALAVILPLLSFVTIPLTAQYVLPSVDEVNVPPGALFSLLWLQIVPLFVGAALRAAAPAVARALAPPLDRVTYVFFVAVMFLLAPSIGRALFAVFGSYGTIAVVLISVIAISTGWLLGGPKRSERFTLSMGTALRNPAIAMVIATTKFPDRTVAAAVTMYFIVQFAGAVIFGGRAMTGVGKHFPRLS